MAETTSAAEERQASKEEQHDRIEKARQKMAEPLEYSPEQHTDRPQCSLSLSGPETISAGDTEYPLTAVLLYHSNSDPEQSPLVISTKRTPFESDSRATFSYSLYTPPEQKHKNSVRFRFSGADQRRPRGPGGRFLPWDPKFAISAENDCVELAPGKSLSFTVPIKLGYWLEQLRPGEQYCLSFNGRKDAIPFWRYGTLESFEGQSFDYDDDTRSGRGIAIPKANALVIRSEEE